MARPQRGAEAARATTAVLTAADRARITERRRYWTLMALGTLLVPANAYFGTYIYVVVQALVWGQSSLLRGPVVVLCLMVAVNALVLAAARRFRRAAPLALNQTELLLLYGMLCMSTCAAGHGLVQLLVTHMAAPFYYASGAPHWREMIWPHVAPWLAPHDPAVIDAFFRGNSSLYEIRNLTGWAVPVLAWSAFLFALFWVLLCGVALLRRQWVEQERLTFPLVHLPLEMTAGGTGTPLWRSRALWAGVLLTAALHTLETLPLILPSVPGIDLGAEGRNRLDPLLTTRPWDQIGFFGLSFTPFVVGVGYLMSLNMSFSCWFLYLCAKASLVGSAALGLSAGAGSGAASRAPFLREQAVGAFLGIAAFALWTARPALARAWAAALRRDASDGVAETTELMPRRLAVLGGLAGLLFLLLFLVAAGVTTPAAIVFVLVYVCFSVTVARIVSEAGAGWTMTPSWYPGLFTIDAFGSANLPPATIVTLHGYGAWIAEMRDNPMPQQMHLAKIATAAGFAPRRLLAPLVWASALGIVAAFWAYLDIYYTYGAASAKVRPALSQSAVGPSRYVEAMLSSPRPADTVGLAAVGFGALIAVGLSVLGQRLLWWPLHPLGYALATTGSLDYMWFPFLMAWAVKLVLVRYGGIRAYRAGLPFFLGLVLGGFVAPTLWGLFGWAAGHTMMPP